MIRKVKGGYKVLSEKGKNLGGPYPSKEQAKKRLADVEKFKHMNKSELCQLCGKCCKCMILPVVKPLQKSLMLDWLDVRDCRVIGETDNIMYVEVKNLCPFLIKSSGKFNCEIYDNRPEGCRVFDGAKYDWLDCLWKYMEEDDMRKSVQITTIDEEFDKAQGIGTSGRIGMRKFVGRFERRRQAKREKARKEAEKRSDIQTYGFTMGED